MAYSIPRGYWKKYRTEKLIDLSGFIARRMKRLSKFRGLETPVANYHTNIAKLGELADTPISFLYHFFLAGKFSMQGLPRRHQQEDVAL